MSGAGAGVIVLAHRPADCPRGLLVRSGAVEPTPYAEGVLDLVERIPRGRVLTYGDIAEYVGAGGPRGAGQVMARWGGGVAWWRVVRADGSPARGHEEEALGRLVAEGTPLCAGGQRVDMARARWDGQAPMSSDSPGESRR